MSVTTLEAISTSADGSSTIVFSSGIGVGCPGLKETFRGFFCFVYFGVDVRLIGSVSGRDLPLRSKATSMDDFGVLSCVFCFDI